LCSTKKTCNLSNPGIRGSDSNAVSGTGCGLLTETGSSCTFNGCGGSVSFVGAGLQQVWPVGGKCEPTTAVPTSAPTVSPTVAPTPAPTPASDIIRL